MTTNETAGVRPWWAGANAILPLAAVVCDLAAARISYAGGRAGRPLWAFLFPAEIVPWFVGAVVFLLLLVRLVRAHRENDNLAGPGVAMAIAVAAFMLTGRSSTWFTTGFSDRVSAHATRGELLQIARTARSVLAAEDFLPMKGELSKEVAQTESARKYVVAWQTMSRETVIDRFGASTRLHVYDAGVDLYQGGALMGHWGVAIYDRNPHARRKDRHVTRRVFDDIEVWFD